MENERIFRYITLQSFLITVVIACYLEKARKVSASMCKERWNLIKENNETTRQDNNENITAKNEEIDRNLSSNISAPNNVSITASHVDNTKNQVTDNNSDRELARQAMDACSKKATTNEDQILRADISHSLEDRADHDKPEVMLDLDSFNFSPLGIPSVKDMENEGETSAPCLAQSMGCGDDSQSLGDTPSFSQLLSEEVVGSSSLQAKHKVIDRSTFAQKDSVREPCEYSQAHRSTELRMCESEEERHDSILSLSQIDLFNLESQEKDNEEHRSYMELKTSNMANPTSVKAICKGHYSKQFSSEITPQLKLILSRLPHKLINETDLNTLNSMELNILYSALLPSACTSGSQRKAEAHKMKYLNCDGLRSIIHQKAQNYGGDIRLALQHCKDQVIELKENKTNISGDDASKKNALFSKSSVLVCDTMKWTSGKKKYPAEISAVSFGENFKVQSHYWTEVESSTFALLDTDIPVINHSSDVEKHSGCYMPSLCSNNTCSDLWQPITAGISIILPST